jgi:CRISPR-associated endonuclease Cas2
MHIMLAWNVATDDESERKTINDSMREALSGLSWVRVMPSVYVVKVDEADERDALHERLKKIVTNTPGTVHYLMSPLMEGGRYNGWLPKRLWPKINGRID